MILDLLEKRFSVRRFRDKAIPHEILGTILEAGRRSPSGGNEQPWLFGVIRAPAIISRVAEAAYQQVWIASAPLLIVLCTRKVQDNNAGRDIQVQRFPEWADALRSMDAELYSAIHSEEHQTKIPGAHMALMALEQGIGCTWVSRFEVNTVAEIISAPKGYVPSEILAFGYPAALGSQAEKKPLDEIVFYRDGDDSPQASLPSRPFEL